MTRDLKKAAELDKALFDRLGIPYPADGSRREGLAEAWTRECGRRVKEWEKACRRAQ